jgi:hypothetical protein
VRWPQHVALAFAVSCGCLAIGACSLLVDGSEYNSRAGAPADAGGLGDARDASSPDGTSLGGCSGYATPPAFCDDFSRADVKGSWAEVNGGVDKNTTIEIVTGEGFDGRGALHVKAGPANTQELQGFLRKRFAVSKKLTFAFDMKVLGLPTEGAANTSGVRTFPSGFNYSEIGLQFGAAGNTFIADQHEKIGASPLGTVRAVDPPIPTGKWVLVRLEVTPGATPFYELFVDGTAYVRQDLTPPEAWKLGDWAVDLGLVYAPPNATGFDALFDNAAVWVE